MIADHLMINDDAGDIHLLLLRHGLSGSDCLQTETSSGRVGNAVGNLEISSSYNEILVIILILRIFEVHLWRIILSSDTAAPRSSTSRYFCRGTSVIIVIINMYEDSNDYANDGGDYCHDHES